MDARSVRICVLGRLVWAESNDRESSRVGTDIKPKTGAISVLRARESA
jgi:hypothetical protein